MKKVWVGTQIFINRNSNLSIEDLRKIIFNGKKYLKLSSLMLWANNDFNMYENFIKICREFEIESYLWFPVLSDIPGYTISKEDLTLNYDGARGYGKRGQWRNPNQKEEEFLFICPNNKKALDDIFKLYKNNIDNFDFDGVFLDRIRYSSGVNGIESIFSCFCKYCAEKFYNRYGLSLKKYKIKIRDFLDNFKEITDRDIKNWYDFKYIWKLSGIEKFVDFKSFSIYNTVKMFSDYARSKSMIVGGDLYTYSMSPVVFQDYNLLQECFDWIKPMMYCHTYGPAGIPLEILCLSRAFKALNYKLKEKSILEFFENIMGVELPKSLRSLTEKGIAEEFVSVELDKIEKLGLSERVDIYPGFEAMRMPGVCIINKTILNSYIDKINKKVKGFIVSWNLLDIPESNLKFINKRLQ